MYLVNFVPISFLLESEGKIQAWLGKGWGSSTTQAETKTIAKFVESLQIKEVVAVDIGANLGEWSGNLLREIPTAQIYAFEPSKEAFTNLELRFKDVDSIKCVNLGVGSQNGEVFLYADKSASGLASLTKRRVNHHGIVFDYKEKINVLTLDTWLTSKNFLRPNIIKIDIEGHELDVLLGAREALRFVQICQFEFGGANIDTRTFFQDFYYFFIHSGFKIYRISPRGPILINSYSEQDETFRPTNYLAVKH
jgi:FkbM family methyltransferase